MFGSASTLKPSPILHSPNHPPSIPAAPSVPPYGICLYAFICTFSYAPPPPHFSSPCAPILDILADYFGEILQVNCFLEKKIFKKIAKALWLTPQSTCTCKFTIFFRQWNIFLQLLNPYWRHSIILIIESAIFSTDSSKRTWRHDVASSSWVWWLPCCCLLVLWILEQEKVV